MCFNVYFVLTFFIYSGCFSFIWGWDWNDVVFLRRVRRNFTCWCFAINFVQYWEKLKHLMTVILLVCRKYINLWLSESEHRFWGFWILHKKLFKFTKNSIIDCFYAYFLKKIYKRLCFFQTWTFSRTEIS